MKRINFLSLLSLLFITVGAFAQEKDTDEKDSPSYYEQRGMEDAEYEQSLQLAEAEEEEFWEEQKAYERKLKKRNRKAYKAYLKGKRDAYAEHRQHCNAHCHHSSHYHSNASFYYYHNAHYRPHRPYRGTTIRTGVGVRMPNAIIRVGI